MKSYFKQPKGKSTFKNYMIDTLSYMSLGLFVSLIAGLILSEIGTLLTKVSVIEGIGTLFYDTGIIAMSLTGAVIGAAIAYGLKSPPLVLFAAVISGSAGYTFGGPVGAYVATVISVEAGKLVSKKTKLDILVTPIVTILVAIIVAKVVGKPLNEFMIYLGEIIMWATDLQPFLMGIIVAVIVGMILTLPISSAALCIMLGLSGLAGGAAAAGCSAQMIVFAVISYRDNGFEGLLSQGIGTSMLQVPNIIKNPRIWIPAIIASAVTGPLSTIAFKMSNTPAGSGMGTSGFVGQISAFSVMGYSLNSAIAIVSVHIIIPAIVGLVVAKYLRSINWIKAGDMKLMS